MTVVVGVVFIGRTGAGAAPAGVTPTGVAASASPEREIVTPIVTASAAIPALSLLSSISFSFLVPARAVAAAARSAATGPRGRSPIR